MPLSDAGWLRLWVIAVLVSVAVHSTTLMLSPVYWIDEAQVLDFGRSLVFEPRTAWSLNWLDEGRPAGAVGYLGPAIHEGAFRLAGLQPWAPRLAAVCGGVAAATMLLGWLWARGLGARISVIGGAVLLVDPTFVQAFRGGRPDGWAIAVALGAAWALHRARTSHRHSFVFASLSGVLSATAPFVWPTAVASLAAVGLELVYLRRLRLVAAFVAAAAATAVLLGGVFVVLHGAPSSHADTIWTQLAGGASPSRKIAAVIDGVAANPGVWSLAVLAPLASASRPFVVAAGVALAVISPAYVYAFRLLYVLPLLVAAAAALGAARRLAGLLLIGSLAWGAAISLGARQLVAWSERDARDPAVVYEIARRIGPGDHTVFVDAVQFYYPGRQLGWRMFRPYAGSHDARTSDLLDRIEVAIVAEGFDDAGLTAAGLVLVEEVQPATPHSRYGPYKVYRRALPRIRE